MPLVNPQSSAALPGLTLKAWARVTSAGVLISGMNIASTSRAGAGQYTVNFTTAMATATYITRVTAAFGDPGAWAAADVVQRINTKAVGSVQVRLSANGAYADADFFIEVYE